MTKPNRLTPSVQGLKDRKGVRVSASSNAKRIQIAPRAAAAIRANKARRGK